MNDHSNEPQRKREILQAELEGRMYQKGRLESELDHFIQTRQDTTAVTEQLNTVAVEIVRLEEELRDT